MHSPFLLRCACGIVTSSSGAASLAPSLRLSRQFPARLQIASTSANEAPDLLHPNTSHFLTQLRACGSRPYLKLKYCSPLFRVMEHHQSSDSNRHPSKLCEACSSIFVPDALVLYNPHCQKSTELFWHPCRDDVAKEVTWYPLHASRQIHEQGLASGCELCNLVATRSPDAPIGFSTSFVLNPHGLWIVVLPDPDGSSPRWKSLEIRIVKFDYWGNRPFGTSEVQRTATAANKSMYTGSNEFLHLVSSWLTHCTTHHPRCRPLEQPSWYPTRLLEISGQAVRLIVTSDHVMYGSYLTLSHCWGANPPRLKLTRDTASVLAEGLLIDSLEPTYRDALCVTRSLGHRYLWIDLFCIYQGADDVSKQDWTRESVLMDQIYAGCALNISAADARDGNGGCYSQRTENRALAPIIVSWSQHANQKPTYYELRRADMNSQALDGYRQSPVFKRGWIVQERMLTPRVLHFVSGGIVWECSQGNATNDFPYVAERDCTLPGQLSNPNTSRDRLLSLWRSAMLQYSGTQLTMPNKDKLVAVQGISKRIAGSLNDDLFFGFLKSTMPQSMCWQHIGGRWALEQTENQSYPSWHFARLNTQVYVPCPMPDRAQFDAPLLALFHNSNVNPALPAVPEFLGCVARTVRLKVKLEQDTQYLSPIHNLNFNGSTLHSGDQQTLICSIPTKTLWEEEDRSTLLLTLDQPCLESVLGNTMWVLMPVSVEGSLSALRKKPRSMIEGRQPDRNLLRCRGLFLQRKTNGSLVRKGAFICGNADGGTNLCLLLEALERARPRFIVLE